MNLVDKVVVVTGASEGLGKEVSKWLSSQKAKVALVSRNEHKLNAALKDLNQNCKSYACDISNWEDVNKTVSLIVSELGNIDVLINNAGQWIQGKFEQNSPERIKEVIDVNTLGTVLMTRRVIENMQKSSSGTIINVISQAGIYSKTERAVYTASKWAITGFTKSLQAEFTKQNIKVMGFYPSLMTTSLFKNAGVDRDMTGALSLDQAIKAFEFMLGQDDDVNIPEIGITDIEY